MLQLEGSQCSPARGTAVKVPYSADVIHMPPLRKEKRKEFLGREQCGQRAMGITQGKMKQEALFVSLLYQFVGISTSENKYMEIVRGIGDSPGT